MLTAPHARFFSSSSMATPTEIDLALEDLVARAHGVHPASWLRAADFIQHARAVQAAVQEEEDDEDGENAQQPAALAAIIHSLHADDLYVALAGARGVTAAIERIEKEHFSNVADFIARIDPDPTLADEVRQTLRHRLFVASEEGTPPRLLTYSGRGPLGGWIRVCAVREAQALRRAGSRQRALLSANANDAAGGDNSDLSSDQVDPELAIMKDRYGDAVSAAFKKALEELDQDHRTMLRMHYVDGLTIEQVGAAYRVSRATAARMLLKARDALVESVRAEMHVEMGVSSREAESILALVRSRIDLSLKRHL
jgi:RNA polymerase sigma-70 factor, ECF subfamily